MGVQGYFDFGSVLVGFNLGDFVHSGALSAVGFCRSGVSGVSADLVALCMLNCCRGVAPAPTAAVTALSVIVA